MNNAANEVKVKNQESAGVNKKKKIIFLTASIVALLIIFFIYATYNQEYVGASDWYGYYSLSLLLKQGRVDLEVGLPPAQYPPIAPLSYFVRDGKVLQQYPPGYPFLMALAGFIGLEFYVTPILGILSIVLMFLLIKDLTDTWIAALFSLLWAFTPIVMYGSTSVMSDLPATVFILLSLYSYRKKKIIPSALALGFSLVVRPTNVLYCLIFLPVLLKKTWKDKQWIKFGIYFAVPVSLYSIYNWLVYGAPWKTGYTDFSDHLLTSVFFNHLVFFIKEIIIQFTPFLVILAIFAIWKKNKDSFFYAGWFLIFLIFYCFWRSGGDMWWWTRFLLPALPALFFLAALGLKDALTFIQSKWKPAKPLVNISLTILTGIIITYFVIYGFNHGDIWEKNKGKIYYDASKSIGEAVPANSFVGSIEFSGCIRLYAGIETFNSSYYPHSLFLISDLLKKRIPVYVAVEPWNREIPTIKELFEVFKVEKVMAVKGWSDFYLYRIARRQRKAYENMVQEWLEKKAK
jgi:4-amino-4-deoxy-L-arabinose transferase-like glycosyltransferase